MKKMIIALLIILAAVSIGCSGGSKITGGNNDKQVGGTTELTAGDYVEEFKDADIPLDKITFYTKETDPNNFMGKPNKYVDKADWADERAVQLEKEIEEIRSELSDEEYKEALEEAEESKVGGTVEVYKNQDDLKKRRSEIESAGKKSPVANKHKFYHKNALIMIDRDLTPKQAADYEKALKSLD